MPPSDDVDVAPARRAGRRRPRPRSSSVALSSTNNSTGRPSRPPRALMSSTTILATFDVGDAHEGQGAGLVGDHADACRPVGCGGHRSPIAVTPGRRRASCAACGLPLCPASSRIGGTAGSDTKSGQPCSSQSKSAQTRSSSVRVAEHRRPLGTVLVRASPRPWFRTPPGSGRRPRPSWLPGSWLLPSSDPADLGCTGHLTGLLPASAGARTRRIGRPPHFPSSCTAAGVPRVSADVSARCVPTTPCSTAQRAARGAAGDADLGVDVLDVVVGGLRGDEQLVGDLAGRRPIGDEAQHLQLPSGRVLRGARCPPPEPAAGARSRSAPVRTPRPG